MKLSYAVKITAWLRFASRNNVPINPAILMQKANDFSQAAGHEDFNLLMDGFVGGRSIHIVIELHTMGAESDGLLLHITVSLTYRRHLESLHKKLTSRVALLRRLAGSGLGVGATTLRTATLALMHSTGEHCAPVWCSIAHTRPHRPRRQRRLANCDWMPASYTSGQPSNPHRHPTCWASSRWSHTVSSTRCHGAWTSAPLSTHPPIECKRTAPKIETPICTRRTTSHDNNNIREGQWADHQWNAEWTNNPTRLRIVITDTSTHPPEWPSQEEAGSGLTASVPVSDVSAPACTNGVWPALRPVSVAQKNTPSTMLFSNVQSIGLPMDCMARRFWTMRQLNGCSTSAPRCSAVKQWFQQLAQKKNRNWMEKQLVPEGQWCILCFTSPQTVRPVKASDSVSTTRDVMPLTVELAVRFLRTQCKRRSTDARLHNFLSHRSYSWSLRRSQRIDDRMLLHVMASNTCPPPWRVPSRPFLFYFTSTC